MSAAMPVVHVWPECSECHSTYVLRKTIMPGSWLWQRDCKHKKADPIVVNADGPVAT